MAPVLAFWSAALILAALAFPIAQRLFRRFPDAGAGLAFPLGLMLCSYGYFLLRVLDVLPQGRGGFVLAFAAFALVSVTVARFDPRFGSTVRRSSAGIVAAAGIFTAAFFGYAAFRSYLSAISGTEQPMDFLFLNAMLESPSYPPEDPWLAGNSVSYYYFGYLQTALLTGASGAESSIGYNLGLAAVFASSATAVASVCAALARWVIGRDQRWVISSAAMGVALLLFAGSLLGAFEFAAAHEQYNEPLYEAFGAEQLLPCGPGETENCYAGVTSPRTNSWYPDEHWYWWHSTRVIPGTITEFPAFSFALGDLHPHVMALPGVILAVAVALALWRGRAPLTLDTLRRTPLLGLVIALVFGGLAFQNTWDVLTFSALLAVAVVARNARRMPLRSAVWGASGFLAPAALVAIVLYAPWWSGFSSQAGGLYAYVGAGTQPNHLFLQFGTLLLAALLVIPLVWRRLGSASVVDAAISTAVVPLAPLAVWALLAAARGTWTTALQERGLAGWVTLLILALLTWAFATGALAVHSRRSPAAAIALLATFGTLLIYGAELLLVRDVFFEGIPRLNTVFKLTYQAWTLLAIAGALGFVATLAAALRRDLAARVALVPVGFLIVLSFAFVLGAVPNRTGGFSNESDIDGLSFLARNDPDEYALTRWIAANTSPGEVIIEASGRRWEAGEGGPALQRDGVSYTDAGRIASRTGRATPIGWYSHEVQWRGTTPEKREALGRRQDAVDAIYLAGNPADALATIREFDADYVVVGSVEQSLYPEAHRADLDAFLDLAFESGSYRIYRVPHSVEVPTS